MNNFFKYIVLYIVRKCKYNIMPIYKDKNGKYYVSVFYKDARGINHRKMKRGFTLQRDAKEWERLFLASVKKSVEMPFDALCNEFLEDRKRRIRQSSYIALESNVRLWIRDYFGKTPVNKISADDVLLWHDWLKESKSRFDKPLSYDFMHDCHKDLSTIFNYAVEKYGLAVNPAAKAGQIESDEVKEMHVWTLEEFNAFIDTFEASDPLRVLFVTLYYSGVRIGEALALTIKDVDIDKNVIFINKTLHYYDGQQVARKPKTKSSVRSIPIDSELAADLRGYINRLFEPKKNDRLFYYSPAYVGRVLKHHAELAGVPVIRVHDLRHSHASLLINMGASPVAVAQRLGHKSPKMTLDVYSHLFASAQDDLVRKIAETRSRKS